MSDRVRPFRTLTLDDIAQVGGKNASLGEMVRSLAPKGVRVPDGFAITAAAYREVLDAHGLVPALRAALDGIRPDDVASLQRAGKRARALVRAVTLPDALAAEIAAAYDALGEGIEGGVDVAVRSSATAEDLPDASFAGQQETYLNVHGIEALCDTVVRCMASLFTDRAISYRTQRGYDHLEVALSVGVQRMVRSDLAGSGVLFTLDTETGFRDVVLVTSAWGLGENVVQGVVEPDEHVVFKPTLAQGYRPIVRRRLGTKALRMVYDGGGRGTRNEPVAEADQRRFVLSDDEVLELARQAVIVEEHYSAHHGRPTPMDLEWAKDGLTGELFIVQARPETVQSQAEAVSTRFVLEGTAPVLAEGAAVGASIATGRVRVISDVTGLSGFEPGEILVASNTDPDWEPVMRKASAIVTDHGGRTCHAAIVARELGVPAVVGTGDATARLAAGDLCTVDAASGERGRVYAGAVAFRTERVSIADLPPVRTRLMLNVGDPGAAFRLAALPVDGVGLARQEFIVNAAIGVHPLAVLHPERLSPATRAAIAARTGGAVDQAAWFVDRLAEGIGAIAAAFHPRPVIVRLSDFKTNEYAHLLGGGVFETAESNPMLGFRGAARYLDPTFADAFALECRALAAVRDGMGLRNVKVMVPFCRTVDEGREVIARMASHGLVQGDGGLEVYVMCEIPSNALLADAFAEVFDGFSIGSNDLTQLTLGIDRDADRLAARFDEEDPAVKALITMAIRGAHGRGRPIGICGQAPSDKPAFAAWLVAQGIDSLSLTPDSWSTTRAHLAAIEASSGSSPGD